ncbi:hypothetical protein GCM10007422_17670 [Pedobacter zeae]|uniref:Uncharacterized protein n=1 Tax=Pedobacter zeae TaxID=1737356 RepID=A0ABQ1XTG2_9SPHI|nr:hypothetical protein GCM10007422_17670 [Pedobacter zeae]
MERLKWLEELEKRNRERVDKAQEPGIKARIYHQLFTNLMEQRDILKKQIEQLKRQIR